MPIDLNSLDPKTIYDLSHVHFLSEDESEKEIFECEKRADDRRPEEYMIATGEDDRKRLDALGAIFDQFSINWIKSQDIPEDAEILDVGCGHARLTSMIAKTYPLSKVLGVDLYKGQIESAKKTAEEEEVKNIAFEVTDVFDLETLKEKHPGLFDVVHTRLTHFHLANINGALDKLMQMVKPGGVLILGEMGKEYAYLSPMNKAMKAWNLMVVAQHLLQKSHKDGKEKIVEYLSKHERVKEITESEPSDIPIEGLFMKSLFTHGVEQGIKKMKALGLEYLIQQFGYEDGKTWYNEMVEFQNNDSYSLRAKGFQYISVQVKKE